MAHKQFFNTPVREKVLSRTTAEPGVATVSAGDERTGLTMRKRVLEKPARQIAANFGVDDGVVVERMRAGLGYSGFDVSQAKCMEIVVEEIVDSTKVVRVALGNAVSVAGVRLLTEATLTEVPEPKEGHREFEPSYG